jgi:RNA polymerase sigma factor (sigma-70 family)
MFCSSTHLDVITPSKIIGLCTAVAEASGILVVFFAPTAENKNGASSQSKDDQFFMQQTEQWYQQYGESVYRRCLWILRDEETAKDVLQEVFVRAHRGAASFRGDASVLTWLYTIADRRCFTMMHRKKKQLLQTADSEVGEVQVQTDMDIENMLATSKTVAALMARFGEDVQQIVVLRFFDELEQEEIASQLGISRKTVQRKLDRFYRHSKVILAGLAK